MNRRLCIAMVERGAEVFCTVPAASEAEREEAAAYGVRLLLTQRIPGMSERESLMRRPALPGGVTPDAVIGHTRITGPAAEAQVADHFPAAVRIHVVHMEPNRIEWYKANREDDAAERAQRRSEQELTLAAGAHLAVPVGPRLDEWLRRDLPPYGGVAEPHRLDPGFDLLSDPDGRGVPEQRCVPEGVPQILVMGRMEDAPIKGLDLAGQAVGRALRLSPGQPRWELLVRGAPAGQGDRLRRELERWIGHENAEVTVHPFDPDFVRIRRDLLRASLVLLPSRAEGFGLAGLEAFAMGTPTLVSGRSGLGMLLRELLQERADPFVLPITDGGESETADRWAHRIAAVLGEREAAFARAAELRALLAERCNWAGAADGLLAAVQRAVAQTRAARPARLPAADQGGGSGDQREQVGSGSRAAGQLSGQHPGVREMAAD